MSVWHRNGLGSECKFVREWHAEEVACLTSVFPLLWEASDEMKIIISFWSVLNPLPQLPWCLVCARARTVSAWMDMADFVYVKFQIWTPKKHLNYWLQCCTIIFLYKERDSQERHSKSRELWDPFFWCTLLPHQTAVPKCSELSAPLADAVRWKRRPSSPRVNMSCYARWCALMSLCNNREGPSPVSSASFRLHTHTNTPPFHLWPFNSHFCSPCVSPASFWTSSSELIGQKCCWLHPTYPKP